MAERNDRLMAERNNQVMAERNSQLMAERNNQLMAERSRELMAQRNNQLMAERNRQLMAERNSKPMAEQNNRRRRPSGFTDPPVVRTIICESPLKSNVEIDLFVQRSTNRWTLLMQRSWRLLLGTLIL